MGRHRSTQKEGSKLAFEMHASREPTTIRHDVDDLAWPTTTGAEGPVQEIGHLEAGIHVLRDVVARAGFQSSRGVT